MYYDKRYLQFNDLVFDGYDMISSTDEQTTYKEAQAQSYNFGHGSYQPYKSDFLYVNASSVSMTLTFNMKKLPCEDRPFYLKFVDQELSRPGKLWSLKNGEVLWAYANVRSKHQITTGTPWKAEYDIEFTLPEGLWHKADMDKTFVLPFNVCTMMECKGFEEYDPCCCDGCVTNRFWEDFRDRCFCCCVDEITRDMALCYHKKELQAWYGCDTPFQLVYSCEHAERFKTNAYLGHQICVDDICESNIIAGRFYSLTDIPTDEVRVTIKGKMKNPSININGNINTIQGEYDGAIIIEPSGDVYYQTDECCEPTLLDPSVWSVPNGMDYGWKVVPQINSVIVNLNECCTGASCIYIDEDAITA